MNTATNREIEFDSDDQFLVRRRVERTKGEDEVVYGIYRISATRAHPQSQYLYDEHHLITMNDPIQVNRLMELLSTINKWQTNRTAVLMYTNKCFVGEVAGTQYGIALKGNNTSSEIICRFVSTVDDNETTSGVVVRHALQKLCAYLNGVTDKSGYYVRRYSHSGIVHNDACMVISPWHEKVVSFTEAQGKDPVGRAAIIASVLNKPKPGSYSMVNLWDDDSRAILLLKEIDVAELVAYPIMSTAECKEVLSIIKTHE
jgi:hypothetical protein